MTAPAPLLGGFEENEMYEVLDRACAAVGLDSTGALLLRGHTNAVVQLPGASVVVKIARRGTRPEAVRRTVTFVRWLMNRDFPTVTLYPVPDQPATIDGHSATFWQYLPQPEHPVTAVQLAEPLLELHQLGEPPMRLPLQDNIAAIRASLSATVALPEQSLRLLALRADHLEHALAHVDYELPRSVVQGDPQHRNALHDGDGVVLCDWDTAAWGQPEWDLVTIEVHCRRFGYDAEHYRAFADAYGFDVTKWVGYPVLRDIRELRMITENAKKSSRKSSTLAEVERRIAGMGSEDGQQTWNIL